MSSVLMRFGRHTSLRTAGQWNRILRTATRVFSTKEQDYLKNVEIEDDTQEPVITDKELYTKEIPVRMPDMGDGKGKVLTWFKVEGDVVRREDILCDIQTPDFTFGLEVDDTELALMGKILVEAPSEEVSDEDIICYLLHKQDKQAEE